MMAPLFGFEPRTSKLTLTSDSNFNDVISLINSDGQYKSKALMFEYFILINEKINLNFNISSRFP